MVHVQDIASAFVAALEIPPGEGGIEIVNIGRQEDNCRIRDLAGIVKEVIPSAEIELAPGAGPDARNYRVCFDKSARVLPQWRPAWSVREGARELAASYRHAGLTVEDVEGARFNRIQHVRMLLEEGTLDRSLRWTRHE
jgi:nucleoside-diphosphate-sugar epimerase